MRRPVSEFPNDNPALHEGAVWVSLTIGGPLRPIVRPSVVARALEAERPAGPTALSGIAGAPIQASAPDDLPQPPVLLLEVPAPPPSLIAASEALVPAGPASEPGPLLARLIGRAPEEMEASVELASQPQNTQAEPERDDSTLSDPGEPTWAQADSCVPTLTALTPLPAPVVDSAPVREFVSEAFLPVDSEDTASEPFRWTIEIPMTPALPDVAPREFELEAPAWMDSTTADEQPFAMEALVETPISGIRHGAPPELPAQDDLARALSQALSGAMDEIAALEAEHEDPADLTPVSGPRQLTSPEPSLLEELCEADASSHEVFPLPPQAEFQPPEEHELDAEAELAIQELLTLERQSAECLGFEDEQSVQHGLSGEHDQSGEHNQSFEDEHSVQHEQFLADKACSNIQASPEDEDEDECISVEIEPAPMPELELEALTRGKGETHPEIVLSAGSPDSDERPVTGPLDPLELEFEGDAPRSREAATPEEAVTPDGWEAFTGAMVEIAMEEGSSRAAAVLPLLLNGRSVDHSALTVPAARTAESSKFVLRRGSTLRPHPALARTADAWKAVLSGKSDDLSACGSNTLDAWGATLLGALLDRPDDAPELRKRLRSLGVAAFGVISTRAA